MSGDPLALAAEPVSARRRHAQLFNRTAFLTSLVASSIPTATLAIAARYPALQDFGGWLYQGRVLAWVWTHQSDAFGVTSYPVPYATGQVALGLLNLLLPPIAAATAALATYLLLGAVAVSAFVARYRLAPLTASIFLTCTIVLSAGFWNGYIGTQLGGVLLLLYLALDRRLTTSWYGVMGFGLLMYCTHAISFAVWALIAVVLAAKQRQIWQFALGILPPILLLGWYMLSSTTADTGTVFADGLRTFIAYKAYTLVKFGGYQNFIANGSGDFSAAPFVYLGGVAANVVFIGILLIIMARVIVRFRGGFGGFGKLSAEAIALMALIVVFLALPQFAFGIVNPGERIAGPALALAAIFLFRRGWNWRRGSGLLAGSLIVGLALTVASAAMLPSKQIDGASHDVRDTETLSHSLLGHRTDQLAAAVDAATISFEAKTAPHLALIWDTSFLVQRSSAGLTVWISPYEESAP